MENKEYASMNMIVMRKSELLKSLIENKAKHDVVLATAIAGYWDLAKEKVEQKRKFLKEQVSDWKDEVNHALNKITEKIEQKEVLPSHVSIRQAVFDNHLGLVYPQDHTKDYDRAIRLMQASIHEEVRLSVDEFDAYVLNNWEWKQNFIASNSAYVTAYTSKFKNAVGPTLRPFRDYNEKDVINLYTISGSNGPQGRQGDVGVQGPQGPRGTYGEVYDNAVTGAISTLCSGINLSNF